MKKTALLEEGASIEQVDAAAQKFGMAMGPMPGCS